MSEAAPAPQIGPARKETRGKRGETYCVRPADEPKNSGLPHYGKLIQHAMIASDSVIMEAIRTLPLTQVKDGWLLKNASITKIAIASAKCTHNKEPLPRRTIAHRLAALAKKGIARRWDVLMPPSSPFGTSWLFPHWKSVLEGWANDPEIGTVGNRAFYVQGKGKRFLTPADLTRWKLDHGAAERNPRAQAVAVPLAELGTQARALDPGQQLAADVDVVLKSLLDQQVPATDAMAADLLALARRTAPAIPAEAVATEVRRMTMDWMQKQSVRGKIPQPLTIGWFTTGMAAAVTLWQHEQKRAEQATRAG